ncbi:MAG: SDR family NAD(P)-dependent oxidoreductase [Nitrospinota bacterium]
MISIGDRVAIVTGGGNGIGKVFCFALAKAGGKVCVADIDDGAAQRVASEIVREGGEALAVTVDVSVGQSVSTMTRAVIEQWGKIHVLVNNAAIVLRCREKVLQSFDEIAEEEWDRVMSVNVKGAWLCTKAVFPQMKEQGYGKIINIASGTIFVGAPYWVHYGASKGAVVGLSRSLARELGPYNISVNVLCPGLVQTEMTEKAFPEYTEEVAKTRCFGRKQYPEDLIGGLLFLAGEHSDFITGQIINVDGGAVFH